MIERSDPMSAKILSPEWAAVLVVDVQNDFCHERGFHGVPSVAVIAGLQRPHARPHQPAQRRPQRARGDRPELTSSRAR